MLGNGKSGFKALFEDIFYFLSTLSKTIYENKFLFVMYVFFMGLLAFAKIWHDFNL